MKSAFRNPAKNIFNENWYWTRNPASDNTTEDAQGRIFIYDAENKQVKVLNSEEEIIGEYFYDGDGKRIKKIVPATDEVTVFVYNASGQLVAEYSTEISQTPKVSYTTADHLGSPRILTDENGATISRRDFHPFGEEIAPDSTHRTATHKYGVGDNVRQKFTGYEHDEETGLDFAEARYYYNNHGRFTAVDPLLASGKSANPQTFNRYAYVMNQPLTLTDPTGLQAATNPTKAKVSDDPTNIVGWKIRGSGQNLVPKGDSELRGDDYRTLGRKNTMTGGFVNLNVDVTFKTGTNPNDFTSERAVIVKASMPNNGQFGTQDSSTRKGGKENPKENQVVVNDQTKTVQDNPGLNVGISADGPTKAPLAGASYTAHFVQGERNNQTGELDSNIHFYKVEIQYDRNGNITPNGTRVSEINRDTFIRETREKDPENLLQPNKKN